MRLMKFATYVSVLFCVTYCVFMYVVSFVCMCTCACAVHIHACLHRLHRRKDAVHVVDYCARGTAVITVCFGCVQMKFAMQQSLMLRERYGCVHVCIEFCVACNDPAVTTPF